MNAKKLVTTDVKLLKRQQASDRYSMSWNTLLRAASECGAIVRYGRSVFLNSTKLDDYFDALSGCE